MQSIQPKVGGVGEAPPRTLRNKRMACVECRQQKAKCDSAEKYPNPCTRCAKKNRICSLNSEYKRTYKRERTKQIEEELKALKQSLPEPLIASFNLNLGNSLAGTGTGTESGSQLGSQTHRETQTQRLPAATASSRLELTDARKPAEQGPSIIKSAAQSPIVTPAGLSTANVTLPEEVLFCSPKQFGEVDLDSHTIRNLYLEYVNKYHKFLPIIDIWKGPERIYRLCPILFWTIMSVSLRHFSIDLLMKLAPLLKTTLAEITISPITRYLPNETDEPILNVSSVYSVQAFLIYTMWPPLTSSLSADSSWNTIGIAVFQAIRIGLNGPGIQNYKSHNTNDSTENDNNNNEIILEEHLKTWISCNIVSQAVATSFGYPAFVSFDRSVMKSSKPNNNDNDGDNDIPTSLRHMIEISHFEDQIAKVLNSNNKDEMGLVDAAERLPLLKVLNQQLDELELRLQSEGLDSIRKFQLLSTRVSLLTYYFLDNSSMANFELRRGLVLVYNSAINFLNHANLISISDSTNSFIKYLPGLFILKIWQAACIVAKLVHSSLSDVIDKGTGKQAFLIAIQLTMKSSILKYDMAYRASGILKNMWQLFKALREKTNISNTSVTIRTRMSASVFFDCLWVLREQVGMIKLEPHNEQAGSGKNANTSSNGNANGTSNNTNNNGDNGNDNNNSNDSNEDDEEFAEYSGSGTKKRRTLSNNFNAEDAARKIIRTIPLDPTPISLRSNHNNAESSKSPMSLKDLLSPPENNNSAASQSNKSNSPQLSSRFSNELDLVSEDWFEGNIWREVDSLMNDFGFSTDDIAKLGGNSSILPQQPNQFSG